MFWQGTGSRMNIITMTPPSTVASIIKGRSPEHQHSSRDRKQSSQNHRRHASKGSVSSKSSGGAGADGDEPAKDIIWEQMFEQLKAIKDKTGTCNLPDKKGSLAKWVYAQRKAFRRLQYSRGTATTRARLEKLESIGFEFSSSSYVAWDVMFEKYKTRNQTPMSEDDARKLKLWMSNQRLEYSRQRRGLPNNITQERIAKLESAGFQWVGRTGKPTTSSMQVTVGDGSLCSKEGDEENDDKKAIVSPPHVSKKRKRVEKSPTAMSTSTKRSVTSVSPNEMVSIPEERQEIAGTLDTNDGEGDNVARLDAMNARGGQPLEETGSETGSLFQVLAAMRHGAVDATQASSQVAAQPYERTSTDGPNAPKDGFNDTRQGDFDNHESDEIGSETSCSYCNKMKRKKANRKKKQGAPNNRHERNRKLPAPDHGGNEYSRRQAEESKDDARQAAASMNALDPLTQHGVSAERFFSDRKNSSGVATTELGRNATLVSSHNNQNRRHEWPTSPPLSFNANLGSTQPVPDDSDPNAFTQLPSAALAALTNGGNGFFIPSYLHPAAAAAAAFQQQLRQLSMAMPSSVPSSAPALSSLSPNDFLSLLPYLGGALGRGVPPSMPNSLPSGFPMHATVPRPADDPESVDLYPWIAHFIHPR